MPATLPVAPPTSPLVARALEILHGRLSPPPLPLPDFVEPELQRLLGDKVPPPTTDALQQIREDWTLQHLHGGDVIVTTRVQGQLVVLAAGEEEVRELSESLPDVLQSRIHWQWPPAGFWVTRG